MQPTSFRLTKGYRFKNRIIIAALSTIDLLLSVFIRNHSELKSNPARILLIKPDHAGDLLMLTAILPLITNRYPDASIDILCNPSASMILDNNPHIRERISCQHILYNRRRVNFFSKLLTHIFNTLKCIRLLRKNRYDICLNFRDAGGDLILLAKLGGCRWIGGHATGGFGPLLDGVSTWKEGCHEIEHYMEVISLVGISQPLTALKYELYPSAEDDEYVSSLLKAQGLRSFSVLHPGAGDPRKLMPVSRWNTVVENAPPDMPFVITGTKEESLLADDIMNGMPGRLTKLTGRLTIQQLFILFQKAEMIYCLDSLAAHLAAAAMTPSQIFWTSPNDPEQWRPLGNNTAITLCRN